MSIFIKGLNVPDKYPVKVIINPTGEAFVDYGPYFETLEAVNVPAPHGRLIDASTKIKALLYDEMTEEWSLKTMTVDDYLAFAADLPTTIIEAEGEAEK